MKKIVLLCMALLMSVVAVSAIVQENRFSLRNDGGDVRLNLWSNGENGQGSISFTDKGNLGDIRTVWKLKQVNRTEGTIIYNIVEKQIFYDYEEVFGTRVFTTGGHIYGADATYDVDSNTFSILGKDVKVRRR